MIKKNCNEKIDIFDNNQEISAGSAVFYIIHIELTGTGFVLR